MDEVQRFIANNQHQFGYIMNEASRQWIKKDSKGALTVGPCNLFIDKYGDYHQLQDENERLQKDNDRAYDILAKVRDVLLPLVNPLSNQCGDMLACTVSNPDCIECLAKQIKSQFSQTEK